MMNNKRIINGERMVDNGEVEVEEITEEIIEEIHVEDEVEEETLEREEEDFNLNGDPHKEEEVVEEIINQRT